MRSLGQWNGYVASGADLEEQRARMAEVPKEIRAGVIAHVRTVNKLKADLEARLNFLFNPD